MAFTDDAWQRAPFSVMESRLMVGQMLESTDKSGACEAYAFVIEKWRNAKPKSLSVDRARSRSKALGCARS
jgi:hypothetical protein